MSKSFSIININVHPCVYYKKKNIGFGYLPFMANIKKESQEKIYSCTFSFYNKQFSYILHQLIVKSSLCPFYYEKQKTRIEISLIFYTESGHF